VKDTEDTAIPVWMLVSGTFIRVQYHHIIMRRASVDHVFITPDIVSSVVESQDFVSIDTIASENDTDPGVVVAAAADRSEVRAYQRSYAR
jgi:hypothetical protein